jgi:serine protease Do
MLPCGLLFVAIPWLWSADEPKTERPPSIEKIMEKISPAVVVIQKTRGGENEKDIWPGLGVVVDPKGIIVTPARRLDGPGTTEIILSDGRKLAPKVLFSDAGDDVAILKVVSEKPLPHAEFGNSDKLETGDWVLALNKSFRLTPEFNVERGLYVGKRRSREKDRKLLYMDSALSNPPDRDLLFDMDGKLLGIWTKTGAVPGNRVKEILRQALEKK